MCGGSVKRANAAFCGSLGILVVGLHKAFFATACCRQRFGMIDRLHVQQRCLCWIWTGEIKKQHNTGKTLDSTLEITQLFYLSLILFSPHWHTASQIFAPFSSVKQNRNHGAAFACSPTHTLPHLCHAVMASSCDNITHRLQRTTLDRCSPASSSAVPQAVCEAAEERNVLIAKSGHKQTRE